MRGFFTKLIVFVAIATPLWAGAQGSDGHPARVVADARAPHILVIREQGWDLDAVVARDLRSLVSGTDKDFAILSAREALAQRRAGVAIKIVYVLSRAGDDFQVLAVSERLLASEPSRVEGVLAAHEQARRWMASNPDDVTRLLAATGGTGRDYNVARPGPALLQMLKAGTGGAGGALETLLDDTPIRAAVRSLQHPAGSTLLSRL
jgi:hypothetical protein